VDTSTAKAFEDALMGAAQNSSQIAVRFHEIDYISSAGLRVVLMLGKKVAAANGALVLTDMPEKIFSVFKISGFDKILKICSSLEESQQFFK
jgi:anti-sigma B factor antagonist/stage II sporulation protein AA (anti-sigma F factor antagonist)